MKCRMTFTSTKRRSLIIPIKVHNFDSFTKFLNFSTEFNIILVLGFLNTLMYVCVDWLWWITLIYEKYLSDMALQPTQQLQAYRQFKFREICHFQIFTLRYFENGTWEKLIISETSEQFYIKNGVWFCLIFFSLELELTICSFFFFLMLSFFNILHTLHTIEIWCIYSCN